MATWRPHSSQRRLDARLDAICRALRNARSSAGRRAAPLPIALALLVALAPPAAAQGRRGAGGFGSTGSFEGPFQVVADEVEYDAARDVYVARGNVRVTQEGKTLTADRVYFGDRTRIGVASGNVVLTEAGDVLTADFLQFDVEDMTGVVFQGRLESAGSEFEMTGSEVQKTGELTYRFENGRFTTCRCPDEDDRDPWTLTAQRADIEIEGYARARNATMEVLGVPVFWAPYLILPVKRERQTGLLFPDFGVSERNGVEMSLPFFWAAHDRVNVLVDPEYLTKRGFKPAVEVEYVFHERGAGKLYGTFIHDREVDRDDVETPFDKNRWGGQWRHVMDLPWASWLAVDGTYVSDNEIPFDFDDFSDHRAERYLHSRALAGTRFGPSDAFWGELALHSANDLQNPNDQDRDELLLQRLPQLSWSATPGPVPFLRGLLASADVEYVHFQPYGTPTEAIRELRVGDFFYDTGADAIPTGQERTRFGKVPFDAHRDDNRTEGDGVFQEGEPLADDGHRLVAHPRLAYPLRIADALELYPEVGWYGTFYDTRRVGVETRNLLTSRVDLRSRLRGEVDLPLGIGPTRHFVEPHLSWVFVSDQGQDDNPFLVPTTAVPQDRLRQLALDNVILDPSDRLAEANSLVFGVNNRLMGRHLGRLFAEFGISSEYRFEGQRWGPIVLTGDGRFPKGWWTRFHVSYDVEDAEFAEGLASFGWAHRYGHAASVRYRYIRDIPRFFEAFVIDDERFNDFSEGFLRVNQIAASARVQITRQWALTYLGSYSFENALSLVQQFGVEYLSRCRCWAVRLQAENDRVRGLSWNINYRLFGLGDDRDRPFTRATGRRFDVF